MTKKYYLEQIDKIDRLARNGMLIFSEVETEMYKVTERATSHLDPHEWMAVKRKMWRCLMDLAKGI